MAIKMISELCDTKNMTCQVYGTVQSVIIVMMVMMVGWWGVGSSAKEEFDGRFLCVKRLGTEWTPRRPLVG